jgi:hypothetical protein
MILLGYVILGHPDWRKAQINIFAIFPEEDVEKEKSNLVRIIEEGRLPISAKNIEVIEKKQDVSNKDIINSKSTHADLAIIGFRSEALKQYESGLFEGYDAVGNILFVNASKSKLIV